MFEDEATLIERLNKSHPRWREWYNDAFEAAEAFGVRIESRRSPDGGLFDEYPEDYE